MESSSVQLIPLQVSRGCVVASIQIDLSPETLRQFRLELLECVQKSGAKGVILDVSGLEIMDLEDFNGLRRAMEMAAIMGATTVLCGFKPGVVSALIDLDADVEGVIGALNLDDAFRIVEERRKMVQKPMESQGNG